MPDKNCITTFTGRSFNLLYPTADMVCIEDIAHHLAMVCRWSGSVRSFFSVAQHSILVSRVCPPELQKWALLHDAAEAYIGDLSRPLKAILRDMELPNVLSSSFDDIEEVILRQVAVAFELEWPKPDALSHYDDQIQKFEGLTLVAHDGRFHDRSGAVAEIPDLERAIPEAYATPMLPADAETAFLARYRKIFFDDDGL